jgi:hypothetical protein
MKVYTGMKQVESLIVEMDFHMRLFEKFPDYW